MIHYTFMVSPRARGPTLNDIRHPVTTKHTTAPPRSPAKSVERKPKKAHRLRHHLYVCLRRWAFACIEEVSNHYQGQIFVRFMAFGNGDLQSLYDHSDGFYRRQLILSTRDKPAARKDDPFLAEKLCAEAESIVLWAIEGLRRLIANDYAFTVSDRARANLTEVKKDANNILDFLSSEGYIAFEAGQTITAKLLYDIYCLWCEDNAFKPRPARSFGMYLIGHQEDYGVEYNNKVTNAQGRRVWGYWGIKPLVAPS